MMKMMKRWIAVFLALMLVAAYIPQPASAVTLITASWQNVGTAGFSTGQADYPSLYVYNGTSYVAYNDGGSVRVKKYNGSSWVNLGTYGISDGAASYISLYVDNGTPYVAYSDSGNYNKVVVAKYDSSFNSWSYLYSFGTYKTASYGPAYFVSLYVDNGTPYVAYQDASSMGCKATVEKYNGSSWNTLGTYGISDGAATYLSLYVDNGTPYVAYKDAGSYNRAMVKKYVSSGNTWETVGTDGFPTCDDDYISLYIYNGTPYMAYTFMYNGRVIKYNSSTSTWGNVGTGAVSSDMAEYISLYVYNGTPYVSYKQSTTSPYKATVKKYNGSSWVNVGTGAISAGEVFYTSLYVYNGIPFVAYQDCTSSRKLTVKAFLPPLGILSDQTLTPLAVGYAAGTQQTKMITLTRTCTADLTNISVSLSGANAGDFTVTQPRATTLNSSTTSTDFTVKAKNCLPEGTYTATISVTADNMETQTFTVIQKVDYMISKLAGTGAAGYDAAQDTGTGDATVAKLNSPYGTAVDSQGNVYIADTLNNRIRKVDTAGKISTYAGGGSSTADTGTATGTALKAPAGVAVDSSDNLYIAGNSDHKVWKVDTSGNITKVAGTGAGGYNGDNIAAAAAQLNSPFGVAADSTGNIYIADRDNHRVRKVNKSDGKITTVAGTGTGGYSADNIIATTAKLYYPTGVAVDSSGNLYIADMGTNRIRKVDKSATPIIATVAGSGSTLGDGGAATSAKLNNPFGVAVDSSGNLYIADRDNHRIRKVDTSATPIITTVAGTGTAGYSQPGNSGATSAQLNKPYGVAVDSSGNLYIADSANHMIRKAVTLGNYTYTIDTLSDETLTALSATYAPGTQETKTVTLTRTGTGDLKNLNVSLSGTNISDFAVIQPSAATLDDVNTSTTFTVKAKDGLAVGTYTATVTVTADNMTDVTFTVTQAVNAPTAAELANQSIAAARSLLPASITVTEGVYSNLLTYLNGLGGMSDTGVTLTLVSSNSNIADNGDISYTANEVTGDVVIHINKTEGTEDTKTISVTVPAHIP